MRRVKSFLKKHNLIEKAKEQELEFGFKRVAVSAESYDEYGLVFNTARKADIFAGSHLNTKTIYLMEPEDRLQYDEQLAERQAALDKWWEKYHQEDEETRRLMACGAIE